MEAANDYWERWTKALRERDALRERVAELEARNAELRHEVSVSDGAIETLSAQVRAGVDGMTLLTRQLEAHEALVAELRQELRPEADPTWHENCECFLFDAITRLLAEFDAAQEAR